VPGKTPSPAATLRALMTGAFSLEELKALAFDLGIDAETLGGADKTGKVIELIQTCARNGRVAELVDLCRKQRPNLKWDDIGVAAASNPAAFTFVPAEAQKTTLNLSPDRAARFGFLAGILTLMIFLCGFGGGFVAGDLVDIRVNPVPVDPKSLDDVAFAVAGQRFAASETGQPVENVLRALGNSTFRPGTNAWVRFNNVQATTLADQLIARLSPPPIQDPHVRFFDSGEAVVNFKIGSARVIVAYKPTVEGERLVLNPTRLILHPFEPADGSVPRFGWLPLPVGIAAPFTDWAQTQLDEATRGIAFTRVQVSADWVQVDMQTK
jgi:Effector-associated domain 7